MDIIEFCTQHDLPQNVVTGLVEFLRTRLTAAPGGLAAFAALSGTQQDAIITQGVQAWQSQNCAYLRELLENQTDRAHSARQQMAEEVWAAAQVGKPSITA